MKTLTLAAAAALFVLCLGAPASAQPGPAGAWIIALSVDSGSTNPLIQEVCLLNDGSWSSPHLQAVGLWFYSGQGSVRLLGNFDPNGSIAAHLDFVNGQPMTGSWTQWRGNTSSQEGAAWARAVFTRKELCWKVAG
jgi:hypothetical protein